MKKILVLSVLFFIGLSTFAQDKNAKVSIEVDGVCLMCKKRIEKACFKTKGVKSAIWNVDTHELQLVFDERKTNLKTIENSILEVGHDVKDRKATDEAYATVHPCCRYRDTTVVEDHNN